MLNYKVLNSIIPSVYLLLLPYKYKESLVFLIAFTVSNKNKKVFYCKIIKSIKRISMFYLCILISILYFDISYTKVNKVLTSNIITPYFISFDCIKKEKILYSLNIYFIIFKVSGYIIKGIMINAIHLIITSNLFLFTKNEILLSNLNFLGQKKNPNKSKINHLKQFSLAILSSYEMFEIILNTFYSVYIGIKCKNNMSFKYSIAYLSYFFNSILSHITGEIYLSIVNLWIRY